MPVGYSILLLSAKQSRENQCNEASCLEKMYQKCSALSNRFEMRRSPFANWIHYIAAKKPQPLCGTKRTWRKRNCGHRLIMHSITRRGRGDVRREWGGGGAGGSFTQTYILAGWNSMTMHLNFQLWLKREFLLTAIWIRGITETRWCVAEPARLQVIMLTAPLTLRASYLPLPPSVPLPFLIVCPYHHLLVIQHMVYRGVSKQLLLTKIIGI